MALTEYQYTISTAFPNAAVVTWILKNAIQSSAIVIALNRIDTNGNTCSIWFNDALSGGDVTILNALVAAHQGIAPLEAVATARFGYASTSSTAFTNVKATSYVEPPSNGLEVVSSSTADDGSPVGTGTRVLAVIYYRGDGTGPFTTNITMDGTTAVAFSDANARFIEQAQSLTVGSNGTNAGTITIRRSAAGATVASIAVGDGQTHLAHHYVAAGRSCYIKGILTGMSGNAGRFFLRVINPLASDEFYRQLSAGYRVAVSSNSVLHNIETPIRVDGFRRIDLTVRSDSIAANEIFGGFHFYDT